MRVFFEIKTKPKIKIEIKTSRSSQLNAWEAMSLSIALPQSPDQLIQNTNDHDINLFLINLKSIPSRSLIFFDESLVGYIIYKTEDEKSLELTQDVYLNVSVTPGDGSDGDSFNEESNYSVLNTVLSSTHIIFLGQNTIDDFKYIIWRFEIPMVYPRRKLNNPKILFSCFTKHEVVVAPHDVTIDIPTENPLPNYKPVTKPNIFGELNNLLLDATLNYNFSPAFEKDEVPQPKLQQPVEKAEEKLFSAELSLPITVSLVIKLKSTKPAGRNNMLLATLNIESSDELLSYLEGFPSPKVFSFKILNLTMDFKHGIIEDIKPDGFEFPVQYKLLDSVNLTYKLINNEFDRDSKQIDSKPIHIKLVLQITKLNPVDGTYDNVSSVITTNWSPSLDFSIIAPPINNSLKTSSSYFQSVYSQSQSQTQSRLNNGGLDPRKSALMNSMYKARNNLGEAGSSTSLSFNTSNTMTNFNINSTKKLAKSLRSSSSVTVNLTTNANSTLSGLKLTFKGKLNVNLGEVINWRLQAINESHNRLLLSLVVQNPINFNPVYSNLSSSTNSNNNNVSSSNLVNDESQEVLVYNKLQLYNLYSSLKLDNRGIVILDNDIRLGPIEPFSVFETDLKLIGLSKGIFNLDGIKIFDTTSGDGIDFGKIVEVFVV